MGPEKYGLELPLRVVDVSGPSTNSEEETELRVESHSEECDLWRVKMPFHHVRAGLLYTDNYLSTSLSETSEEQLANISTEELGEIREAFRVLDRDGNGFISKQELGMAMRSLGYMPSEVELAIIMQRLDMDGDGQVDFDEFMTILGPKLVSSETREGFLGSTIDSIFWQASK
ncbi:calcium-binding protein 8 isoform X4 [Danio rerio]|uniref:Calcium-binding protein 8 isoform X4 n=1 Tax=Danio rerio TaxID=7955 RepID=A0AC58ICP4_DANRE|nr:calcium-binding protein 8-like isoform X3 [Danio rerio]|eukprot:XP_021324761.1 calcium-binding protein 8-like isoform X3 [Danio rerio]